MAGSDRKRLINREDILLDRNIRIITDLNGNKIVLINDIIFKGKKSINWDDVKMYLESYVGEFYEIADTNDIVYIGNDLPDEYTGCLLYTSRCV